MLLVIDVGNTHITLGVFDGKELKATFRTTAKQPRTSDEYGIQLCDLLEHKDFDIKEIALNLGKELIGTGKKIGKIPGLIADSLGGLAKGKMKINFELTGYEEPLDRIGIFVKYIVLSLIACILFIGGCILATIDDLYPKTENGMPLIAIVCIVFAIALAIYSVGKLTMKKK